VADRKSLIQRRDELEGKRRALDAQTHVQPTEVHIQTIEVLTHLLEMGKSFSTEDVPAHLKVLMRTIDKMKPTLTAELASVPPEAIVAFMGGIADEIAKITGADPTRKSKDVAS
jgi:precorrin-6x reductase